MASNLKNTIEEDFEDLDVGDINGQGSYTHAGTWSTTGTGADCSCEVVAGKMLVLSDDSASNQATVKLTLDSGYRPKVGYYQLKYYHSANKTSVVNVLDSSSVNLCGVGFNHTGQIRIYDGSSWSNVQAYSTATWYTIKVAFDLFNNTVTLSIGGVEKATKAYLGSDARVASLALYTIGSESGLEAAFDDLTFVGYADEAVSDTVSITDSISCDKSVSETLIDTVHITDSAIESGSYALEPDYGYYFGSYDGKVYAESSDYKSDDGNNIDCFWISKQTDFADQYQVCLSKVTTIYKIKLWYVDNTANTNAMVSISPDGGVNWTDQTKTVGNGDGTNKPADFYFHKTSHIWQFRVRNDTDTDNFQWIAMQVFFTMGGDYFDL